MTQKATRRLRPLKIFRRASNEHEMMSEYIAAALRTQALFEAPHPTRQIKTMQKFLTEQVVTHFRFEEENVFPHLAAKNSAAIRRVIKRLVREHQTMLTQVATLQKQLSKMTDASGAKAWHALQASFGDLLRMLLVHTMTEDGLYQAVKSRAAV
jgi:iron-sulfur cluster repair protein YtfE (RIC family)